MNKIVLWLALSLLLTFLLLPGFWGNLPLLFSPAYIKSTGAYPWAVLGLCLLWLFFKKHEVTRELSSRVSLGERALGAAIASSSLLLRNDTELSFLVLGILLIFLGVFTFIFGSPSMVPGILLGVYAFSVVFPRVFTAHLETPYALITVKTVASLVGLIGYPVQPHGQVISFTAFTGEHLGTYVGAPSSGIASVTIFIALFALMNLDFRPGRRRAIYLFLFGLLGTSLQNILRLALIVLAGYHFGHDAMVQVHDYAGYIMFPAWYMAFAYVYLRNSHPRNRINKRNDGEIR
jgi:exosortase/archaeosortase family protein